MDYRAQIVFDRIRNERVGKFYMPLFKLTIISDMLTMFYTAEAERSGGFGFGAESQFFKIAERRRKAVWRVLSFSHRAAQLLVDIRDMLLRLVILRFNGFL